MFDEAAQRIEAVLIVALVPCFCLGGARRGTTAEPSTRCDGLHASWRGPERDGLHCLYILSHLGGHPLDYEDLLTAVPAHHVEAMNLRQLEDVASGFGLHMTVARRTPSELTQDRLPVIAHLDDPLSGYGGFVLVLSCSEGNCQLVTGNNVTIENLPMDEFRRCWSGYVLERSYCSFKSNCFFSAGIGVCLLGVYMAARMCRSIHQGGSQTKEAGAHLRAISGL